mgnify:CR=1 FL=1
MQAYTYVEKGKFALLEKPKPVLLHERDAIVKVTLASICSSDLHIKHGALAVIIGTVRIFPVFERSCDDVRCKKRGGKTGIVTFSCFFVPWSGIHRIGYFLRIRTISCPV